MPLLDFLKPKQVEQPLSIAEAAAQMTDAEKQEMLAALQAPADQPPASSPPQVTDSANPPADGAGIPPSAQNQGNPPASQALDAGSGAPPATTQPPLASGSPPPVSSPPANSFMDRLESNQMPSSEVIAAVNDGTLAREWKARYG